MHTQDSRTMRQQCIGTRYGHTNYTGEYAQFEDGGIYKLLAYIDLQDPEFPELMQLAADANQQITTNALTDQVIADTDKATRWTCLADLQHILFNTGPAATVCRDTETATSQVQHSSRNTIRVILHKDSQDNTGRKQV